MQQNLFNPPPPEAVAALPKPLRDLFAEWVAACGKAGQASSDHAWLRTTALQDDKDAAVADLAQAAANARAGGAIGATPNADALAARRAAAATAAGAAEAAVGLIVADLDDAFAAQVATGAPAKAVENAREKLAAGVDAFREAVTGAARALALERWLRGAPYQEQAVVSIADLAPVTRSTVGPALLYVPPCDVLAAIEAIAHFADDTDTH